MSVGNDTILRTLGNLEKQQEDISNQIEMMSRKMGQGNYTHELSEFMQEYAQLKLLAVDLQEN